MEATFIKARLQSVKVAAPVIEHTKEFRDRKRSTGQIQSAKGLSHVSRCWWKFRRRGMLNLIITKKNLEARRGRTQVMSPLSYGCMYIKGIINSICTISARIGVPFKLDLWNCLSDGHHCPEQSILSQIWQQIWCVSRWRCWGFSCLRHRRSFLDIYHGIESFCCSQSSLRRASVAW